MTRLATGILAAAFFSASLADVYLHHPRGSNNRCDEKSNDRNNDERCFDSENNAAGGYAVCGTEMFYYEKTVLPIEWYSQHACGNGANVKTDPNNPESVHCQIVLQLGCEHDFKLYAGSEADTYKMTDGRSLGRPGEDRPVELEDNPDDIYNTFGDTCTQTKPTSEECAKTPANDATCDNLELENNRGTFNGDTCKCSRRKMQTYCYYEPEAWWLKCKARERNKGLFTAEENPNNNGGATKTRQEPNSDRYGFECTEERDYWPYWHPSPWRDLVVFTTDTSKCGFYQSESQNVKDKCECVAPADATAEIKAKAMYHNQMIPCTAANFEWKCWGSFNWNRPECLLSPAQADNALGRISSVGDDVDKADGMRMAHYDWLIPEDLIPAGAEQARCQIRIRYNISTAETADDFDVADNNKVKENPVHTIGSGNYNLTVQDTMPIRMAINTAQFGRTFEDRTYIFQIRKRPAELRGKKIHNLNYRGKRGNIAQVRNCVEYDFMPPMLDVQKGDMVHFQWCGSEYNPNGNAGEGRAGTDRINICPIKTFDGNVVQALNDTNLESIFDIEDLKVICWLGQKPENCYTTNEMLTTKKNSGNDPKSCHFLNGVRDADGKPTGYFTHIAEVKRNGVFKYMGSRNNNFTNRSQKGQIKVGALSSSSTGAIIGGVIGGVAGLAAIAGIAFLIKSGKLSLGRSKV